MSAYVAQRPHPVRRSTRALTVHQVRYEWLSFVRNRQARFFTMALPVLFLVIFCALFGNGTVQVPGGTLKESTYYVPGLVGLGLIQAAFASLVVSVTVQRESGILKRRRATPVPAGVLIAARALTAIGTALLMTGLLIAIGAAFYGARVPGRTIPALIVTVALGAVVFCTLGYALVSAINSADSAQPVVQAVMLPLYFISGIFVPTDHIPHWLAAVANFFPVRHLQAALLKAFNPHTVGAGFAWHDLLILAIWGGAGLAIATARFGWQPKAR
jgi:ABC-2 type transport system permease protein